MGTSTSGFAGCSTGTMWDGNGSRSCVAPTSVVSHVELIKVGVRTIGGNGGVCGGGVCCVSISLGDVSLNFELIMFISSLPLSISELSSSISEVSIGVLMRG